MFKQYIENYDEQQDDDYNPTKRQQAIYRMQHDKKRKTRHNKINMNQLWKQLQQEYYNDLKEQQSKKKQSKNKDTLKTANQILNSKFIKPDQKVIFAGKEFIMNQETGQLQQIQKKSNLLREFKMGQQGNLQQNQRHQVQLSYQYLNHVLKTIYDRGRKINSIGKSKIDWKGFVKSEGIQHKLKQNRKAGVIQNIQFLKNAS